jgi:circadian clock protein KaiB
MQTKQEQSGKANKNHERDTKEYVLRLFITGATPNSTRAVENLRQICEDYIKGKYSLEIIDVYQQQEIAEIEQLVALPFLIKSLPLPERRMVGDLSDKTKVLKGLGITE